MCSALVTTESPPTWASGRQHSQRSAEGSTPRYALVASAEAATAAWVSTTPFGAPVVPDVAMTRASPFSTGTAAARGALLAVGAEDGRRPQRLDEAPARREGQPLVERQDGVAGVEAAAHRVDEGLACHEVEGDEAAHGG